MTLSTFPATASEPASHPFGHLEPVPCPDGPSDAARDEPRPPAILDVEVIASLRRLEGRVGRRVLPGMLEILERTVPVACAQLRAATVQGDAATLRQVCHRLKSSTRCLGLLRLSQLCAELERLVEVDCSAVGENLLAALEREYERGAAALGRLLLD